MASLLSIAVLLAIGAFTPGPNNVLIMRAARDGFRHALPAMLGIALGSVALVAGALVGADLVFAAYPALRPLLAASGCAYLLWMAYRQLRRGGEAVGAAPHGAFALFAFQLVNPKGWSIALTAIAALPARSALDAFAILAPLYAGSALLGLSAWALLGGALRRFENHAPWLDRALAVSLALCALALLP